MLLIKTPQNSRFQLERSQELLKLIDLAHKDFDQSKLSSNWDWYDDTTDISLDRTNYRLIKRFGFAEYWWSFGNLVAGTIRNRVPFGFVAEVKEKKEVFVVFRGTMTSAEWINNFNFKPNHESFLEDRSLGQVHKGFNKIYTRKDIQNPTDFDDDLPSLKDEIETALEQCQSDAQVYVTGHSLGGALATLATLHIKIATDFKSPILYAFANPRVGNRDFASHFNNIECYRIANSEDIVPTVPLASVDLVDDLNTTEKCSLKEVENFVPFRLADLDYQHIGEPIYFTFNNGNVADNHVIPTYRKALDI